MVGGLARRVIKWLGLRDRRGSVAVLTTMMAPLFIGTSALGVEASYWMVLSTSLQRSADMAALAATIVYNKTNSAQTATNAGADVAELNGVTGVASRTWTAASNTLQDGSVLVKLVTGVQAASNKAFQVTVQKSVPLSLSKIFTTADNQLVTATAISELVVSSPTTAQPCVVTLGNGNTATTTITVSGSSTITATSCSVRANGGIDVTGSSSISSSAVYAGGSITTSGSSTVSNPKTANAGVISDPYASNTALTSALGQLSSGGTAISVTNSATKTISPGTYASISVQGSGTLNMNPGLYVVNGDVSVGNSGIVNGTGGVTIVSSGSFSLGGSGVFNVTAPNTTPTGSAVPGIVFASKGTTAAGKSVAISGSSSMAGVIYFPNGNIAITGSSSVGASGCLEYISATMTVSGSSSFGGNCSSFGAASFSALPPTTSVALVQ